MTHCFFVPLTPRVVLAVPDDVEHRRDYEHFATETIDVPNIDGNNPQEQAEVTGLLSAIFGVTGTTMHGSTVTVRARRRDLVQIEYTLSHLFLPKPQVVMEVKTYLVSIGRNRNVGVQTPQQITVFNVDSEAENLINSNASVVQQLIDSGTVSAGNTLGIAEALITGGYAGNSVLSSPFVTFGGGETLFGVQTGAASANLSLTSTYSQQLQEVTLQLLNDQKGSMKIGERYPVMTSSTVNLGSSASTATPAIQYEDLGITLEAQPHIAANGEVLLHLHEVVRSLDGAVINSIPVLDNQEFVADLSVPAGATTVVVSNLSSTDARTIQGLAALLPTNGARNRQNAELVITLTPVLTRANLAPQ
jgi:general secretion pathway protein D